MRICRKLGQRTALVLFLSAPMLSFASFADTAQLTADSELVQGCAACHGADGNSAVGGFPSLAGQSEQYLMHELMEYKTHHYTSDMMTPAIEPLSEQDLAKLARYWSAQKAVAATPPEPFSAELLAKGKELYTSDHNKPLACSSCHEANGIGNPETQKMRAFPRVAGQQSEYLSQVMQQYAAGKKTGGLSGMRRAARAMSEDDIKAVAAYMSTLDNDH